MNWLNKITYLLTISFFWLLSLLPVFLQKGIAYLVYFLLRFVLKYRKKVIWKNLNLAFPEKPHVEIKQISNAFYLHMAKLMIENAKLKFATTQWGLKHIVVPNKHLVEEQKQKGRNVIFMTGHSGNWEYGTYMGDVFNYKNYIVYKKLSSPVFEKFYREMRTKNGAEVVETKNTLRQMVQLRNKPIHHMWSMAADQRPQLSETQYWTSFMGQKSGVHLGSEKLAQKFDMTVFFANFKRIGWAKYELDLKLITENPKETPTYYITDKYLQLLEESIRATPYNWLWSHNRWKNIDTPSL